MAQLYLGVSLLLEASMYSWEGCSYRMIWHPGNRKPAHSKGVKPNKGSLERISSSSWLLGCLEGPGGVSPVVEEAAVIYSHLLPADHVSVLTELPPSSRKGPFHELIQCG